jgi:hypothetical protein
MNKIFYIKNKNIKMKGTWEGGGLRGRKGGKNRLYFLDTFDDRHC